MSGSRHTLLSAPLDCVEPGEAARLCASWASAGGSHHNIISLNARTIVTMTGDPRLRAVLERASLVLADGEVAGWDSVGHRCGPGFFFEGKQIPEPARIYDAMVQFIRS